MDEEETVVGFVTDMICRDIQIRVGYNILVPEVIIVIHGHVRAHYTTDIHVGGDIPLQQGDKFKGTLSLTKDS